MTWLGQHAPSVVWHCPQLSVHPAAALQQGQELLAGLSRDVLLIGSSLGGFYATWLAGQFRLPAVLINPAIHPHLDLQRLPPEQINPCTGERYILDAEDMACLQQHQVTRPDSQRFWLILGSNDEVLDWRIAVRHFQGSRLTVFSGDNHRLERWPSCLPGLLPFSASSGS